MESQRRRREGPGGGQQDDPTAPCSALEVRFAISHHTLLPPGSLHNSEFKLEPGPAGVTRCPPQPAQSPGLPRSPAQALRPIQRWEQSRFLRNWPPTLPSRPATSSWEQGQGARRERQASGSQGAWRLSPEGEGTCPQQAGRRAGRTPAGEWVTASHRNRAGPRGPGTSQLKGTNHSQKQQRQPQPRAPQSHSGNWVPGGPRSVPTASRTLIAARPRLALQVPRQGHWRLSLSLRVKPSSPRCLWPVLREQHHRPAPPTPRPEGWPGWGGAGPSVVGSPLPDARAGGCRAARPALPWRSPGNKRRRVGGRAS